MIPEAVVFDLGKVLLDFDYTIAARRIAQRCEASVDQTRLFIDQSPLLHRYECGEISTQEFFEEICRLTGFSGTADEFASFFGDIFSPIPIMIDLHAALRRAGVPTYIFSNTNDLAIRHVRERYPFFQNFQGYILSYEHGVMKPDPRIYQVVERVVGRTGSAIAYLDDKLENVEAGRARGWQVVHHDSPERSIESLGSMGLRVKL
ncbi:MAG TPA: HAD family phosphatase [Verrucomicrobia bacterium]|nr:HAD family phosphatase [Verrucomicrobiota bacterium]HOP96254.1 HAD family phosphatase [Verrucomicrobiota bacterium]HPU55340.1 HAD family phosphatase [Verrucomicrobiota bacterium]